VSRRTVSRKSFVRLCRWVELVEDDKLHRTSLDDFTAEAEKFLGCEIAEKALVEALQLAGKQRAEVGSKLKIAASAAKQGGSRVPQAVLAAAIGELLMWMISAGHQVPDVLVALFAHIEVGDLPAARRTLAACRQAQQVGDGT
jgi:hypothetical protein